MTLKFYTDTHIAKQVAVQLRQRGVDIVRCEDVGLAEADDETHLEYAAQNQRALISIDADFRRYYHEWIELGRTHYGIFSISSKLQGERGIGTIVTELHTYWLLIEDGIGTLDDDIINQIIWIK